MKPTKKLCIAVGLAVAALSPGLAHAAGAVLLKENFNNIGTMADWAMINNSVPAGLSWFQGNAGVFGSQAGPADSYIAANYLSAQNGMGSIDNWLITPVFTMTGAAQLSFFTRSQTIPGMNDMLEVRFSSGSGTSPGSFTTLLTTIGGPAAYPSDWQQITANLMGNGAGRIAFHYLGDAAGANYIGIDTVSIMAVPEPGSWLMLGVGMLGLSLLRRTPSTQGDRHVER